MSPLSNIFAPRRGATTTNPTARTPADDLQLRVHISRESQTTTTAPTVDSRTSSTSTLPPPPMHHSPRQLNDDAFGEFFGGRAHRTRAPQQRAPPPYAVEWDGEKLPDYSLTSPDAECDTVARHLFKYGFFFPLFWAVGVYFLFVPIRVSADWQPDKTEEEKAKMLSEMRALELKWAKRCLWALLSFFVCLAIVIVAVVVVTRH